MFETSKDILYVALALSAIVLTFFLCWALYYIVMMLKKVHLAVNQVSDLITSIRQKIDRLEQLMSAVEDKLKDSASYIPLLLKGVSELIDYFKQRKAKKDKTKAGSRNT
ncbi:MAG: hypothetical protein PHY34_06405 [Patescibacteria group bacterium]|nr:hypothetical protein [Patescibacteria group bacterium]MDD5716075.1 hypothetical protein [Patescibacteria group bacterium]